MNEAKEKIFIISEKCIGKSFYEMDELHILEKEGNKGALGHVIEENIFGIARNNNPQKDLYDADMELKVTPYKKNQNGTYSAKERLVLNIIDYKKEYKYSFYESSFWKKNSDLFLFLYEHIDNLDRKDFKITHVFEMQYSKNELKIIVQDFQIIKNKILLGKAHEISEADTMYLGACTKGATALSSFREQPFSALKAKQRAYSLKTAFMTQKVREIISSEKYESVFIDEDLNEQISFEQNINFKIEKYFGTTEKELRDKFGVLTNSKNVFEILFAKMLGIQGKISKTEEFLKANIIPKFIRLKQNGKITESMSFPAFKFKEIANHNFEDSEIYEYFTTQKFLFVVFEYNQNNELYFSHIKLWNMPMSIIDKELRTVYDYTKKVIKSGKIIKNIDNRGRRITNFPSKAFNNYVHVRPHGRNRLDVDQLPVMDKLTSFESFTKQCFWLNNDYISDVIADK